MSDKIKVLKEEDFQKGIAEGMVLVDFYADWCGPCRMLAPELEVVARELDDIVVAKVDIDEAQQIAASYQVSSVPTLILFRNGEVVEKIVGLRDAEALKEFILSHK